jgi:hypothetical protein
MAAASVDPADAADTPPPAPSPPVTQNEAGNKSSDRFAAYDFEYQLTYEDALNIVKSVAAALSPKERAVLKLVVGVHPLLRKAFTELASRGELGEVAIIDKAPEELIKAVEVKLTEALRPYRIYKVPADRLHELVENIECVDDGGRIVVTLNFTTPRGNATFVAKYDEFYDKQGNVRLPPRLVRWLKKYGVAVTPGRVHDLIVNIDRRPCTTLTSQTTTKIQQALLAIFENGDCADAATPSCADIVIDGELVHVAKPYATKIFVKADLRIRGKGAVATFLQKEGILRGSTTHRCGKELINYYVFNRQALEKFLGARVEELCRKPVARWLLDALEGGDE